MKASIKDTIDFLLERNHLVDGTTIGEVTANHDDHEFSHARGQN